MSRLHLWYLPPAFFSQAGHGGGELPAFPAPSRLRGGETAASLGRLAPRERWGVSAQLFETWIGTDVGDWILRREVHRHCEERSDEAIQTFISTLDCFASLAMTQRRSEDFSA